VSKADAAIRQSVQRLVAASELRVSRADAAIRQGLQRLVAAGELRVNRADAAIRQGLQRRIGSWEMALQRNIGRISKGLLHKHADVGRLLDQATHRIQFAAQTRVSAEVSKVALKEALIKASDPRNILALGYVLVTGKDNKVLKTVDKVSRGDRIGVRFSDGSLTAKVDEVYSDRKDNDKVQIA